MKTVPLSQGLFALVDEEDYGRVTQFKWSAYRDGRTFYATRNIYFSDGRHTTQKMHIFIADTPKGFDTHHINENGLDNQKKNLETLSRSDHKKRAVRLKRNNTSGFCGVSLKRKSGRWSAAIFDGAQRLAIGYFDTPEEAARARDAKARELGWPEDGMNFPNDSRPVPESSWIKSNNTTGFSGVFFRKDTRKFRAFLVVEGKRQGLGQFCTAEEAARARDQFARRSGFPESKMNFPETP